MNLSSLNTDHGYYRHYTAIKVLTQSASFHTFSPYHYEMTHLIVDECFKLCFPQFALVTRVFVENSDNSDHAVLQIGHTLL